MVLFQKRPPKHHRRVNEGIAEKKKGLYDFRALQLPDDHRFSVTEQSRPAAGSGQTGTGTQERHLYRQPIGLAAIIGIHAGDPFRPDQIEGTIQRARDTEIGFVADNADAGILELCNPRQCIVRTTVVHDYQFKVLECLAKDAADGFFYIWAGIMNRHQDRYGCHSAFPCDHPGSVPARGLTSAHISPQLTAIERSSIPAALISALKLSGVYST